MAWNESLEQSLAQAVGALQFSLETLSVVCVLVGLVQTLRLAFSQRRRSRGANFPFARARLRFGSWLSLALEFQLGADIVATTTAPSDANLIRLAVLAAIRTFLNIFLAREMEQQQRLEEASQRETALPPLP